MNHEELKELVFYEVMKIRAITEILYAVDPHDIDRNTLAGLGVIVRDSADRIYKLICGYVRV